MMIPDFSRCLFTATLFFLFLSRLESGYGNCISRSFEQNLNSSDGNPLRGFLTYSPQITAPGFPLSMEYNYFSLKDAMTGMSTFNWTKFEAALVSVSSRKRQMVVRFYVDMPGEPTAIPSFLTTNCGSQCVSTTAYTDYGGGVAPNYTSPILAVALENFISAFGAKYDGDIRIGFVQIGLVGFWGEWHTYPRTEFFEAASDLRSRVIQSFGSSFTKTRVVVSQDSLQYDPLPPVTDYTIGWHDDDFGSSTCNGEGWSFQGRLATLGFTSRWQTVPIGGEVQPSVQNTIFAGDATATAANTCSFSLKFSWLLYYNLYTAQGASWYPRALNFYRNFLGYQLVLTNVIFNYVSCSSSTDLCGVVSLRVKNAGNAPFYYPLKVKASVGTRGVASYSQFDLKGLLPSTAATSIDIPIQASKSQAGIVDGQSWRLTLSLNSSYVLSPIKWAVSGINATDGSVSVIVPPMSQCVSAPSAPFTAQPAPTSTPFNTFPTSPNSAGSPSSIASQPAASQNTNSGANQVTTMSVVLLLLSAFLSTSCSLLSY